MGFFRFRRSIRILPGLRWNFGKRGSSISIGGRGARVTFGSSGTRSTVGIPGTGISYTEYSKAGSSHSGSHGCLTLLLILIGLGLLSSWMGKGGSGGNGAASSQPSPQPAKAQAAEGFPDARYWPKEVRIGRQVELEGRVEGGFIRQVAKPGSVLDATLSGDHSTVFLRRLGITGSLPVGDTDFLKRAEGNRKAAEMAGRIPPQR